jgi:hypothetical protein
MTVTMVVAVRTQTHDGNSLTSLATLCQTQEPAGLKTGRSIQRDGLLAFAVASRRSSMP